MNQLQQQQDQTLLMKAKVEQIVEFINNPNQDKIQQIIEFIQDLSKIHFSPQIEYYPGKFCALSSTFFNQTVKEDFIEHKGYYFLASKVREYYRRGDYYDISIGDLQFTYYDGNNVSQVLIELTSEFLEKIFSKNYVEILKKSAEFYQMQEQKIDFICQKTLKKYFISDGIRIDHQDVSIFWALDNLHLLDENQKNFVLEYQKLQSSIR
ncbi:unnamed protein product [Paramecium sonneborni]|uniref:Uncharacterized protein n=1 Tax=Paramecium sonneborni TaxID=65129 RepID=A0A8S1K504_9CILI|nr:unnamed protein product [Paramecium sonneborni]